MVRFESSAACRTCGTPDGGARAPSSSSRTGVRDVVLMCPPHPIQRADRLKPVSVTLTVDRPNRAEHDGFECAETSGTTYSRAWGRGRGEEPVEKAWGRIGSGVPAGHPPFRFTPSRLMPTSCEPNPPIFPRRLGNGFPIRPRVDLGKIDANSCSRRRNSCPGNKIVRTGRQETTQHVFSARRVRGDPRSLTTGSDDQSQQQPFTEGRRARVEALPRPGRTRGGSSRTVPHATRTIHETKP